MIDRLGRGETLRPVSGFETFACMYSFMERNEHTYSAKRSVHSCRCSDEEVAV